MTEVNEIATSNVPIDTHHVGVFTWEFMREFYNEHLWEIWLAILFAAVFAIVIEIIKKPCRTLYKKIIGNRIDGYIKNLKARSEVALNETEIRNSIRSNYNPTVSSEIIASSINKHNALTTPKKAHYTDPRGIYHLCRRFKLFTMLSGEEAFLDTLSHEMFLSLSSKISVSDLGFTLSLRKETNRIFSSRMFAKDCAQRTKSLFLDYMESGKIEYNDGDDFEGANVILLESFLISPEIMKSSIEKVQSLGGNVKGIVILFCADSVSIDFSSCEVASENVIVGAFINLKLASLQQTTCNKKTNHLKYNEY